MRLVVMRKPSSGGVSIITTSNFPRRELREFESKPTQVRKCSQDYASRCKSRTWSLRISPIWGAEGGDAWGLYSAYAQYFRGVWHGLCDSMRLLVPLLKIPRMAGYRLLHAVVPIQEGDVTRISRDTAPEGLIRIPRIVYQRLLTSQHVLSR